MAGHGSASLGLSKFEIDTNANLKVDHAAPSIDWASVSAPDEVRRADLPTGQSDDSYGGGAKEDDTCPSVGTGSIPNQKSDLLTFGTYVEDGNPGFLHLFWSRVLEPSGTTLMDFELNQLPTVCANGVNKVRKAGDLLIEYRIEQGGATAQLFLREWTGSAWGTATDLTASNKATGTINSTAIPASESDGLVTGTGSLTARTFGEASIDLSFIFNKAECTSFGSAFLKSRSSTSFTSQLKDFIAPASISLSNCGSIKIIKQTDPDGAAGTWGFSTTGALTPSTFNLSDNGEQVYTDRLAGTYTVTENAPTTGEFVNITCTGDTGGVTIDDTNRKVTIVLAADDDVVCTFNNRLKGSILVNKVSGGQVLAGAGFTITPGDLPMTETSTGVFCRADLAFGSYTVTESKVPNGYNGAAAQTVTVSSTATCAQKTAPDLTFTNSPAPGRINIAKADDASSPLNNAVFTLYKNVDGNGTIDPADTVVGTCTTGVSNFGGAGTPGAGTCSFIDVPIGNYWVDETGVPAGYAKAAGLPVQVTVTLGATAGTGQTINLPSTGSFVNAREHKIIVIVCHEGTNSLAPSALNGALSGTSISTAPGFANEAQLCSLPGTGDFGHANATVNINVGSAAH